MLCMYLLAWESKAILILSVNLIGPEGAQIFGETVF